jgi:agmatinase
MNTIDPNAPAPPSAGIFGLFCSEEESRVILLPVPFDATTSYHKGAALAPQAILDASHQVELFDIETGHPYRAGIHMLPPPRAIASWNAQASAAAELILARRGMIGDRPELKKALDEVNELGEKVEQLVHEMTAAQIEQGRIVGIVGGDHSVPLGAIRAYAERRPGLGILHIDAHADLRQAYEGFVHSHASIMGNVVDRLPGVARIVQVAVRDLCPEELERITTSQGRIVLFHDTLMRRAAFDGEPWARVCDRIVAALPQDVYVSCDIDGLDPALCPHTGTPVPGGLSFAETCALLRTVVRSGRQIVGFDLCEVAPNQNDLADDWDANVGARLLYKLIGFSLMCTGV